MGKGTAQETAGEKIDEAPPAKGKINGIARPDDELPLSMDEMYCIRLQPSFIERLSDKGKNWLAKAMINMLVVDKVIDPSERSYLEDALSLIDTDEGRAELLEALKKREVLAMENLNTDRDYAGHFFYYLAMIVAADGKVKASEVSYLTKICGKLGFPPTSAKDVLHWATHLVKMNKKREQMVTGLRQVSAMFSES